MTHDWLEAQTSLWLMRMASAESDPEETRDTERAPPVRIGDGDDEESTLESLTTRMQACDFAALVDADEDLVPWLVNERHGV